MAQALRGLLFFMLRVGVLWVVDAVALGLTALLVPGFGFSAVGSTPAWLMTVSAAFVLGLVNLLIRPLVLLLARPLGFFVLFGFSFLVNALTLALTAWLLPGFGLDGLLPALVGGIVFAFFNIIITGILEVDEEGSFYQGRMERLAARSPFEGKDEPGVGLVMMEIDGLSYHHMQKALADGLMPTLSQMMQEEGYVLSRVDCGIPSQTSACQAGIMFGRNDDIPAFRWFDKEEQKLYVSSRDAAVINARYADGTGLLRGGSSIDNMMNGDAEKSLLTLADLRSADRPQKKRRAEDIYLLSLAPYFLMRTLALTLGNAVREVWEGWRQKRNNVNPRLNRLAHLYPLVRAATSVFVRDLSAQLTVFDILRGAPAIYVTWPGYDEVAHHSGPWTSDAFGELRRYDQVIARIRRVIKQKAPRPYELIVLSDHGQSFGPTFKQRYGVTLKELIEQFLPQGTTVAQSIGGDTGVTTLSAAEAELRNISDEGVGGSLGRAVADTGTRAIERGVQEQDAARLESPAQVTAYGSGNLAQVYFDLHERRITLPELEAAYPGMVEALVQHEGIGLVAGYDETGVPVALGKGGKRNLHTGEIAGEDPLVPYAPDSGYGAASLEKRVWQVRRVMDFPHSGDLMVISTIYPDGTVAALEELIGNHGGMGGEQTDAFLFHPPTIEVPDTRNSTDVFHILNGRRGAPVAPAAPTPPAHGEEDWAPASMLAGIARVSEWSGALLSCLTLSQGAYERVARDPSMTGPAHLIALVMLAVASISRQGEFDLLAILAAYAAWWLATLVVYGAGYLVTRKGSFARTFRALGFAQGVLVVEVLALFGPIARGVHFVALAALFVSMWMGAAAAHEARGWRTLVLPVAAVGVAVLGAAVLHLLVQGTLPALDALADEIGLARQ